MTDKPSCNTCPMKPDRGIMDIRCPITLGDTGGEFPSDIVEGISKLTGMTCHPQAREYLMADVLKELGRLRSIAHERMIECINTGENDGRWHSGKEDGFVEATTLIRNGVEK